MSRTDPKVADLAAVALLECPFCGATPGQWCVTASGAWATYLHVDRERPLREVWHHGYLRGMVEGLGQLLTEFTAKDPRWRVPTTAATIDRVAFLRDSWLHHLTQAEERLSQ